MNRQVLKLGTRGSDLARTQSETIAAALAATGIEVELLIIRTAGDDSAAAQFGSIGPQGVFVREIETALLDGAIDLAVHSFKDLPTRSPDGLMVAAVPFRYPANDVLLIRRDALETTDSFMPLHRGARVGTSSARRRAWLRHFRQDLVLEPLRGNVPTRLRRLVDGDFDAIMLAAAGLSRLAEARDILAPLLAEVTELPLDPQRFVPAPAQGALAVQCRINDAEVRGLLDTLDDPMSRATIAVERDLLARAEGGCDLAFGAYCSYADNRYHCAAMLERSGQIHTVHQSGYDPDSLAELAWQALNHALAP